MAESKAEYLQEWRKKNPEKTKQHTKNAKLWNARNYQKNKVEKKKKFKADYHKEAISSKFPYVYYEDIGESCENITLDHDYFDKKFPKPRTMWITQKDQKHTLETLEANIQYVLRLQNKGYIPHFIVPHVESILIKQELRDDRFEQVKSMQATPKEDWSDIIDEYYYQQSEKREKLLDENYKNHISKSKKKKLVVCVKNK